MCKNINKLIILTLSVLALTACTQKSGAGTETRANQFGTLETSQDGTAQTTQTENTDEFAVGAGEYNYEADDIKQKLTEKEKEYLDKTLDEYKINNMTKDNVQSIIKSDEFNSLTEEEKQDLYEAVEVSLVKETQKQETSLSLEEQDAVITDIIRMDAVTSEDGVYEVDEEAPVRNYTDEEIESMEAVAREVINKPVADIEIH